MCPLGSMMCREGKQVSLLGVEQIAFVQLCCTPKHRTYTACALGHIPTVLLFFLTSQFLFMWALSQESFKRKAYIDTLLTK